MNQNTSWLRKPDVGNLFVANRRSMMIQSAIDNNASITLHTSESARAFKPAPRKSCIMNTDRPKSVVPPPSKSKIAVRGKLPIRSSMALNMAKKSPGQPASGRKSLALQSRLVPRRRAAIEKLLPQWAEEKVQQATPLHMSTPRDPVRSILKQRPVASSTANRPNAAKKVVFDAVTEPPPAFEESTISFLPLADVDAPLPSVELATGNSVPIAVNPTVVDASTNTDDPPLGELAEDSVVFQLCARKMNEFTRKLTDILSEMREFQRAYKLEGVRPLFQSQLAEIQEMSENITPSLNENRSNTITPQSENPSASTTNALPSKTASTSFETLPTVEEIEEPSSSTCLVAEKDLYKARTTMSPRKRSRPSPNKGTLTTIQSLAKDESAVAQKPTPKKKTPPSPRKKSPCDIKPSMDSSGTETDFLHFSPSKPIECSIDETTPKKTCFTVSEEQLVTPTVECESANDEKENVGPNDLESNVQNLDDNVGHEKNVKTTSPLCMRRSSRLRGHVSPAAPVLALSRRSKIIKKKNFSRIRESLITEGEEDLQ